MNSDDGIFTVTVGETIIFYDKTRVQIPSPTAHTKAEEKTTTCFILHWFFSLCLGDDIRNTNTQ